MQTLKDYFSNFIYSKPIEDTNSAKKVIVLDILFFFLLSRALFVVLSYFSGHHFIDAICQWDCFWYLDLADKGYDKAPHGNVDGDAANWAFFPLYPLLISAVNQVVGLNSVVSGILLSNIFFIIGLYFCCLFLLISRSNKSTRLIIFLGMFGPYSFYFTSVYTEALFFMLSAISLYLWKTNKLYSGSLIAACLSATRAVGVFWVIAAFIDGVAKHGVQYIKLILTTPALLFYYIVAPMGLFSFMFYLQHHMGDAFSFSHVQLAWQRTVDNPFVNLWKAINVFEQPMPIKEFQYSKKIDFYMGLWGVLGLIMSVWFFYFRRWVEACFSLLTLLIPLSTGVYAIPRYIIGVPTFILFIHDVCSFLPKWTVRVLCCLLISFNVLLLWLWYQGHSALM